MSRFFSLLVLVSGTFYVAQNVPHTVASQCAALVKTFPHKRLCTNRNVTLIVKCLSLFFFFFCLYFALRVEIDYTYMRTLSWKDASDKVLLRLNIGQISAKNTGYPALTSSLISQKRSVRNERSNVVLALLSLPRTWSSSSTYELCLW